MSDARTTTPLILPARCKLCQKEFALPPQIYELGTNTPTADLIKFSQRVSNHLLKQHPERVKLNLAIYQMYDSYSVLACFHLTGPLAGEFDKMRHQLHKHTRLVKVSDQKLLAKVAGLGLLNRADQQRVLEMITEMRDIYEEKGLHPEIDRAQAEADQAAAGGKTPLVVL